MTSSTGPAHVRAFLVGVGCTCAVVAVMVSVATWGEPMRGRLMTHVLTEPMIVSTDAGLGMLPVGCVLRFRAAIPEGGDYYDVVIRVGPPLPLIQEEDPTVVSPIHAASEGATLRGDDLLELLRQVHASRQAVEELAPRLDPDPAPAAPIASGHPVALAAPMVVESHGGVGVLPEGTILRLRDDAEGAGGVYEVLVDAAGGPPDAEVQPDWLAEPLRSVSAPPRGAALLDLMGRMDVQRRELEEALGQMPK